MPRRQIDADQPPRIRRDERAAQPGAAAGVEHVEALRRLDARVRQHPRHQRRGAVQQLARAWHRSWRRSCRRSVSTNPSDARAGTSRPEHAASMCRAIGWSGSSLSHSSKIATALSTSPSVQCASASSLRASGCFGLKRDHLAEADDRFVRPLLAVQQDAEVGVRVRVLGVRREWPRDRPLPLRPACPAPSAATPRLLCALA